MSRRYLTRGDVLKWNDLWSAQDRLRIGAALDAIPSAHYYVPASQSYVGVLIHGALESRGGNLFEMFQPYREGWHRALVVYRGWLQWPWGKWTDSLDKKLFPDMREDEDDVFGWTMYYQWHPLSTMSRSGRRGSPTPEEQISVCPRCYMALPKTGQCDC